jgi:hypothetical protein
MKSGILGAWIAVAVGVLALATGLLSVRAGRTQRWWKHQWEFIGHYYDVERKRHPIQFWILVTPQLLIGVALLWYGVKKLIA